jgi:hypothetical protein
MSTDGIDSDGGFSEQLPDDNPFADVVRDLREQGKSWEEIHELGEAAYNVMDSAAYEESKREAPIFEAEVVIYDDKSTSGERYDYVTIDGVESSSEAKKQAEEMPEVIRVAGVEQTDTVTVV